VVERYRLIENDDAKAAIARIGRENVKIPEVDFDPAYRGKHLQLAFTIEDEGTSRDPGRGRLLMRVRGANGRSTRAPKTSSASISMQRKPRPRVPKNWTSKVRPSLHLRARDGRHVIGRRGTVRSHWRDAVMVASRSGALARSKFGSASRLR